MRNSMPTQKKIWDYWNKKYQEGELKGDKWSYVFEDDNKVCFACCYHGSLQRAHIVPHFEGGSEDVGNLHLLCYGCHQKTEGFATRTPILYYGILEHTPLWLQEREEILRKIMGGMNMKECIKLVEDIKKATKEIKMLYDR